ncbi:MAG: aryl-sulfate sulfotransferase [Dehalococcoidia bacterium]
MGWSKHHPTGLIHHDPAQAFEGYTLFSMSGGQDSYLVVMGGRVCHRWHLDEGISYGFLLDNGNMLIRTLNSAEQRFGARSDAAEGVVPEGKQNAILELDWDGNVVWEYRNPMVHHDFVRLANGNTLAVVFDKMPDELASRVRGGRDDGADLMLGDGVVEVTPAGETVWRWRAWEALDPEQDAICPLEGRGQWTHQNSLNVTASGELLVSFRQIDTVGVVDRASGRFTWKWGRGEISHQHNPTWLDNGHVLLFDNGPHRGGATFSRVIEVDPASNEIAWEYRGSPPISFYSFHISGAERLPNGNTLICEGAPGRHFEVTPDSEIVWEYVNPHLAPGTARGGNSLNSTFRAHRYGVDHPALKGRDLQPLGPERLGA